MHVEQECPIWREFMLPVRRAVIDCQRIAGKINAAQGGARRPVPLPSGKTGTSQPVAFSYTQRPNNR